MDMHEEIRIKARKERKERHDKVRRHYYPFTDECPKDGKPCIKEKCQCWLSERQCWDNDFGLLVEEVFDASEYDYIHFGEESGNHYPNMFLHFGFQVESREDSSKIPMIWITLGFNSERLANKVKEKFKLDSWEVEGRNYEGGDDHALELKIPGLHDKKDEIKAFFQYLKDLLPKISEYEKEVNVCNFCHELVSFLIDHGRYSICSRCQEKILKFVFDDTAISADTLKTIRSSCRLV